ncbi:hypothetical protein EVC45_41360 [Paraburkholderia sp. UYCP14C]|uniref:hypothetical protein n=1 Tax=Paraburkholderia sp. UYCP14C TaxID=2511130 RepID=UPI001021C171|nr:hypothetical protein [Paraburkholderia sp. UYCP14C]RZF23974.1 hypothetical protein EVC45_41360 [Paraburkholderia sp. UYCP14C]
MPVVCPKCGGNKIEKRNLGKKIGASVGLGAGAILGGAGAARTVSSDPNVQTEFSPSLPSMPGGPIVAAALAGAAVLGLAGAKAGEFVDQNILDNLHCHDCDYTFSE